MGDADILGRLREIMLAMPEVTEQISHRAPCFYLRGKKALCRFHESGFHGDGSRVALWCRAMPDVPAELVAADPDRFFHPTPSASGIFADWLGIHLDGLDAADWDEVEAILEDAYRRVAPKKLAARLDER